MNGSSRPIGHRIDLGVLDLVPITSGSSAGEAYRNSVDLATRAEQAGYARYWFAEHHLNPGVAGTTPALAILAAAAATSTIRVGSGAVLMGHHTPLSVVEEFGILDALHPGRIDLGLGRSGAGRRGAAPTTAPATGSRRTERGLLIPPPFSFAHLFGSPRFRLQSRLLQQPDARTPDYDEQVDDIVALLRGTYRDDAGEEAHVVPGEGAGVELWVLGSSGGVSAEAAGSRGLPFAANYHVAPANVLDAVASYRASFRPAAPADPYGRQAPHVSVSADVVVAPTADEARELATGYGLWVLSIRDARGAIAFPTPDEARRYAWTDDERALVADRIATQFVGSAADVADQLEILAAETGADELLITTITHDHADRVRSYELLAAEWQRRQAGPAGLAAAS